MRTVPSSTTSTASAFRPAFLLLLVSTANSGVVDAFCITSSRTASSSFLSAAQVGIFYGTSTGSTQECADMIAAEFGDGVADGPFDIETIDASALQSTLESYDALIVGSPTWNTAADTERSGTGWDELYYNTLPKFNLAGKKVAVFGLGDQISYSENYADAAGELFDVFEGLGCKMFGFTSQDGYEHEDSKTIRGDKFCGLLLDMVNQEELSEERIQNWVAQLRGEGFLDNSASVASVTPNGATGTVDASVRDDSNVVEFFQTIDEHSNMLDETIESYSSGGYSPYYNPKSKSTMWVSVDGRSCYYTVDPQIQTTETMTAP